MRDLFDIQLAVDAVVNLGRLTEMSLDVADTSPAVFDGEDWNVLVQGDLIDVVRVKGEGALLVQGSLAGDPDMPCRVDVAGDAVICGDVRDAQITASNIHVGGNVRSTQLTAAGEIRIGSDMGSGRIVVGDYDFDRKRLETCRSLVERSKEQAESLGRRVGQDEKRMAKSCRALRIPLDFSVGQIVEHSGGRVSVDLSAFYRSVDDKEAKLDVALGEFFAKGIIGVIARANRKYLVNYPAREKIFMQLLKGLRELFIAVMERDQMLKRVTEAESELESLRAALSDRNPHVAIRGRIAPEAEMEFILPQLIETRDGEFDFAHKTAQLCILPGALAGQCEVATRGTGGERATVKTELDDLEGLLIGVDGGQIRWTHVGVAAVGGV